MYENILNRYSIQPDDKDFRRSGYNAQHINTIDIGTTPNSKPNPFVQGSQLQQEAENVVQAFLMSEASEQSMQPGYVDDQIDSGIGHLNKPGKIEDLPSPTGPYGDMQVNITKFSYFRVLCHNVRAVIQVNVILLMYTRFIL